MNANKSVSATFNTVIAVRNLLVYRTGSGGGTVVSAPPGINCGTDCAENFSRGTSVSLTAVAAAGSVFTAWTGACTGAGSCAVTMDKNRTVTAKFDLNTSTSTRILWPLRGGPSDAILSTGFKYGDPWLADRLCGGYRKRHVGVDINFSEGQVVSTNTKVFAVEHGIVRVVKDVGSENATTILIDHDGRFTGSYQHLQSPNVVVGQEVSRGQEIARLAPISAGTHLHFGIRLAPFDANIGLRGALPYVHGPEDYYADGSYSGCKSDPLISERSKHRFVDPLDLAFDENHESLVGFRESELVATRKEATVHVLVTRTGDLSREVAVSYGVFDGSARRGRDFKPVDGQLVFGPGESIKTIEVPIIPGTSVDESGTFFVTLFSAQGGGWLSETRSLIVHLLGADVSSP
jgi:uncharacterized repeat protein (TIGR02543 family)